MKKYWAAFLMNLQEEMQRRASLVMERIRSLALVLSLYFLWTSLLTDPSKSFLGYTRSQMLTYVLGLALLRALVLTNRAFELTWEIGRGRISAMLLRPISLFAYQFSMDLSDKTVRVLSALVEIAVLIWVFQAALYVPEHWHSAGLAALSALLAMLLYFLIGLALASSGFWSSESIGFLWAASLAMEFASGAFFPLDVLPKAVSEFFLSLPFPYLIYFPINVYLERLGPEAILKGLGIQIFWIGAMYLFVKWIWGIGMRQYQAEGG